ncbi:MAG: hypothetical protein RLZZ228_449 [Actinomycetota bacterium]
MSSPVRTPARRRTSRTAKPPVLLAPMSRRVTGAAIDMALLIFLAGTSASLLERLTAGVTRVRIDEESGQRAVEAGLSLPLWLPLALLVTFTAAYTIVLMAVFGRTLGGWAVGIRCVRADTGGRPRWSLSVRRWFLLYGAAGLLAFAPVIGPFAWVITLVVGLSPLWDATQRLRGYADHLGHDIVVLTPRGAGRP